MAGNALSRRCLLFTLLMVLTTHATTGVAAEMTKFEWKATESGPRYYPMEIISGNLEYHDGSGATYVPNGSLLNHGWGKGVSSHVIGDGININPLPNRLTISFFSYTDNQFYRGDFELPYEKILGLFQAGFYSPNQEGEISYRKIVVGVAPGGVVAVWLWGIEKNTEVFFGQAEKVDIPWSRFLNETHISREEFVQKVIKGSLETPERIEALRKNGVPVGLWERYRTRYPWQPFFTGMKLMKDAGIQEIHYFNGERDYFHFPLSKEIAESRRAVPSFMRVYWDNPNGRNQAFLLNFDEAEIISAFQTLGKSGLPITFEFSMRRDEDGVRRLHFIVHTEKERVILKKTALKAFGAKDK
ncbi:hypothetical protein MNBD_GAMMA18-281 [hydrothermal vent metagenome]|uniref:DUF2931 family protein n=1 Tax=hydrothermal vent metagenome TaxID=652676 RepID=A0A3B1A376_9ZZZZ